MIGEKGMQFIHSLMSFAQHEESDPVLTFFLYQLIGNSKKLLGTSNSYFNDFRRSLFRETLKNLKQNTIQDNINFLQLAFWLEYLFDSSFFEIFELRTLKDLDSLRIPQVLAILDLYLYFVSHKRDQISSDIFSKAREFASVLVEFLLERENDPRRPSEEALTLEQKTRLHRICEKFKIVYPGEEFSRMEEVAKGLVPSEQMKELLVQESMLVKIRDEGSVGEDLFGRSEIEQ